MRHYSYIDESRLQSYFEQIGKVKIEGVKFSANFMGIGGEIGIKKNSADSNHKMVEALIKKLEKDDNLAHSRPLNGKKRFVLEKCVARPVKIPNNITSEKQDDSIMLWISGENKLGGTLEDPSHGTLCLFQGYHGSDKDMTGEVSEYTLFLELVYAMHQDKRSKVIAETYGLDNLDPDDADDAWGKTEKDLDEFATNPVEVLKKLKGKPLSPREIEVLYIIRMIGSDWGSSFKTVTVFGYPIFIANL
jgi:hypothetical protein